VAAFVLLCQAAAWVHAVAIPHVTCIEHGEPVHLDAQEPAPAQSFGDAAVAQTPDEATAHAHEHCNLQGHRTATTPPPALTDVADTAIIAVGPAAAEPPSAVSVLRLAPKTSPPRTPGV
jgi:hypothetical protein